MVWLHQLRGCAIRVSVHGSGLFSPRVAGPWDGEYRGDVDHGVAAGGDLREMYSDGGDTGSG